MSTAPGHRSTLPVWAREHGLLLANSVLFVLFLVGMAVAGVQVYNSDQVQHGETTVSFGQYLLTGDFIEAVFENWESEFLQMGMLIVLTIFLFQKGSAESKPIGETTLQDDDPRTSHDTDRSPKVVLRGGVLLTLYENSLAILFFGLFIASFILHAVGGARAYSADEIVHGGTGVSPLDYMTTSQFWFESLQNWQSEFMVVAVMVIASVYLRQRGSAESKPVATPHEETGA